MQPTFKDFKNAVASQVEFMTKQGVLFRTAVAKEELQENYLNSFPEGTNPIYRERRVYEGTYDLSFIGHFGNVVTYIDGERVSVWDIEVGGYYQVVINHLREMVHNAELTVPYFHFEHKVGVIDHNFELREGGTTHRWDHFFFSPLPEAFVIEQEQLPTNMCKIKSQFDVLKRALDELSLTCAEVVLELIELGNLYRGDEMKHRVELFIELKNKYDKLPDGDSKTLFVWEQSRILGAASGIRNSSIGTLLVDLSEGMDLDDAVNAFEHKVSEGNYKRTSSVATSGMIEKAKKAIVALGLEEALYRRYARLDDLTINNVLFANRDARKVMCPFEQLKETSPVSTGKGFSLQNAEEISVDNFMKIVVPKATNIEVLFENRHTNSLVSLIAPECASAGNMLKWNNNFSWSYRGEVTDSIRDRVKKAGGNVEGVLRCSLSWTNLDDLDIHLEVPSGESINFNNKRSKTTGGQLDVDMNAYGKLVENAVENVFWKTTPPEGIYKVTVHNYTQRCTDPKKNGFEIEVDDNGSSQVFSVGKNPRSGQYLTVVEFNYTHADGVQLLKKYLGKGILNTKSENVWGIDTGTFQKVNMIMNSPNHWDGECTGNKHLFFSLANCKSDAEARGFYNEFLRDELYPHRKSFEMLGGMLKAPVSDDQVSGLGFSSTKRNDAIFKVDGRLFKVLF